MLIEILNEGDDDVTTPSRTLLSAQREQQSA